MTPSNLTPICHDNPDAPVVWSRYEVTVLSDGTIMLNSPGQGDLSHEAYIGASAVLQFIEDLSSELAKDLIEIEEGSDDFGCRVSQNG